MGRNYVIAGSFESQEISYSSNIDPFDIVEYDKNVENHSDLVVITSDHNLEYACMILAGSNVKPMALADTMYDLRDLYRAGIKWALAGHTNRHTFMKWSEDEISY